jgi:hypothetical protein
MTLDPRDRAYQLRRNAVRMEALGLKRTARALRDIAVRLERRIRRGGVVA